MTQSYLPHASACKRSWRTDETMLRRHVMPAIGAGYLDEIGPAAIAGLLNRMREQGYAIGTMNRVLVLVKRLFNLARQWRTPGVAHNPAGDLKLGPEVVHTRYLSSEELERLMHALAVDENRVAAQAILLLLLTGARRNEITHARWQHVDLAARTLLVPLSKSGKPRTIVLGASAIALLRSTRAHRRQSLCVSLAADRTAVAVVVVSVAAHPHPRRARRRAPARPAAFLRQLPGQPRRLALCGAAIARASARARDRALFACDAAHARACRRRDRCGPAAGPHAARRRGNPHPASS